ncbi:c-type cytochrome [Flavobacteriaceae bacterium TP-CH-4]|uniref:C-type cytochrome n=1 Tax=Pelagihabitans pacificus TaxID=2696054 RepID=A0A967B139_9FLAO|nr:PVC-type heme-binding CxxCH protein [Pelagihabitans pacificus]NHF61182.1 c-type cytochrome [Pelagihabitans pacificus]
MKNNTKGRFKRIGRILFLLLLAVIGCTQKEDAKINIEKGYRIVLLGNNLGARMMNFGHFETEMHQRYPESELFIRNMCDGGDTPGFRPHSGRMDPWPFEGAEEFQTELAKNSGSEGVFEKPDEWLHRLSADIIIAFFGYNESFNGPDGLNSFKKELEAFVRHTSAQKYNDSLPPNLVLVSPIAFEDLSEMHDLPDGSRENKNLELYTDAIREIAQQQQVDFIDAFHPSKQWYTENDPLTIDGFQLNSQGYMRLAKFLSNEIFGSVSENGNANREAIAKAVQDKNFYWHNDYKVPNGVHVFGRRYAPYGPDNYPYEIQKTRELTANRDTLIWSVAQGKSYDIAAADSKTTELPPVETNYKMGDSEDPANYLYGEDALQTFSLPKGYKIELFASEREFPDLANPVQISFDNKGRLWVAVMPSYPHYRPGDPKPSDKLLILEDTDGDGRADKQTTFVDGLHLPIGFEFAPEGVYVSQGTHLKLYTDTDGDDKADTEEIVLSGFDDHDTHHAISAFCADPSGAFYMAEGVFLHTNVETPYGPVRATNGGFYRYSPQRKRLERVAQVSIPNPWGIAFDDWGQDFFIETSGTKMHWMMPSTLNSIYGVASPLTEDLIEKAHRVRPTSGLEFVSSRHFPDVVQGDILLGNTIGFLGLKQHRVSEDGTGFKTNHRQDLISSTDSNFRPVDIEFAPDGSLYMVDWHNVLVGHMQHNARDPLRDHVHGRIYRITYPSRPLVQPSKIAGATIPELLENLKLPEYRTRYRTRREIRGRSPEKVSEQLKKWVAGLDSSDARYEHHLLEALWVSWGINQIDSELLARLLSTEDHRARAAAVRVLRYMGHQVANRNELMQLAANDSHGRVRLEAIVAATWMDSESGEKVLDIAQKHPLDRWMKDSYDFARTRLSGVFKERDPDLAVASHLKGADFERFKQGKKIYETEGYCITCHQENGGGLQASGYPTLVDQNWVLGSKERLIKLTLNGLYGPMNVMGTHYEGQVPMLAFRDILKDDEIAAVLTYVRNAFGNKASVIDPATVRKIREETKDKKGFWTPDELLKLHPDE